MSTHRTEYVEDMSKNRIKQIANRHVARCLSKIEEVHSLPEVCAEAVRREMHYCADDVAEAFVLSLNGQEGRPEGHQEDDNRGNR
tara:strand:- start:9878 stop:10132 length:255 start_codon:yes stop_codon:yes gene_type:complete